MFSNKVCFLNFHLNSVNVIIEEVILTLFRLMQLKFHSYAAGVKLLGFEYLALCTFQATGLQGMTTDVLVLSGSKAIHASLALQNIKVC